MACPHCGSVSACRNGHRNGCQRWLCRNCGQEYLNKSLDRAEYNFLLAVAGEKQTEGLVGVQNGAEKGGKMGCEQIQTSGLLKAFPEGLRGKILEFAIKRENQGYKGTYHVILTLRKLVKSGADLYDPESAKSVIKRLPL